MLPIAHNLLLELRRLLLLPCFSVPMRAKVEGGVVLLVLATRKEEWTSTWSMLAALMAAMARPGRLYSFPAHQIL